jgi:hypothetical protein
MELPSSLELGSNVIRLFMVRTDPPGMLVPTEVELPCIMQFKSEYMDIRPVSLDFEFDGKQLVGKYAWSACASCVECYMGWETTMEIVAILDQERMDLSIGIRHMGHNIQDDYLRVEMWQKEPDRMEPRILCRRSFDCAELEFVSRD